MVAVPVEVLKRTETGKLDPLDKDMVKTALVPSETVPGLWRVQLGVGSSSMMVTVWLTTPMAKLTGLLKEIIKVSFASSVVSEIIFTVIFLAVCPGRNETTPLNGK